MKLEKLDEILDRIVVPCVVLVSLLMTFTSAFCGSMTWHSFVNRWPEPDCCDATRMFDAGAWVFSVPVAAVTAFYFGRLLVRSYRIAPPEEMWRIEVLPLDAFAVFWFCLVAGSGILGGAMAYRCTFNDLDSWKHESFWALFGRGGWAGALVAAVPSAWFAWKNTSGIRRALAVMFAPIPPFEKEN